MIPSINHQLAIVEHIREIEAILRNYERTPGNRIDRLYKLFPKSEQVLEILEEGDTFPSTYAHTETQPL